MNTHLRVALFAACIPALLLPQETDTELRVLCSNGFRAAMEKLLPDYERAIARRIKVEYGPSANFKRSIEAGEPFDLAILTPQFIEDLTKQGATAKKCRKHLRRLSTGGKYAFRGAPAKLGKLNMGCGNPVDAPLLSGQAARTIFLNAVRKAEP